MLKLEHKFYSKSPQDQKKIMVIIGGITGLLAISIIVISVIFRAYFLIFVIAILLSIIAPFIDAPTGRKNGSLIYYSPLFITTKERKGTIIMHGGTLFDYVFAVDPKLSGAQRKKLIILGYLKGLIKLIEAYEHAQKEDIIVRGTSYIINERTANKIGLKTVKTDASQWFILVFNYIPLTISYSYAKGKLSFPSLSRIKTYEGRMGDLIKQKDRLNALATRLMASG